MHPPNVIIVHGTFGSPEGNWFPWMKAALESRGIETQVPCFPTPEGQSFEAWEKVFHAARGDLFPAETILVGHSLGPAFLLRLAEKAEVPFRAIYCVSPFVDFLGDTAFDTLNADFVQHDFDWPHVRQGAQRFVCYAGDNDPYVPLSLAQKVADNLKTPLRIIKGGGHLNAETGWLTFPALLEEISDHISNAIQTGPLS